MFSSILAFVHVQLYDNWWDFMQIENRQHIFFFFFFFFYICLIKDCFLCHVCSNVTILYGMYEIKAMFRLVMDFNVEITCFDHKHVHGK